MKSQKRFDVHGTIDDIPGHNVKVKLMILTFTEDNVNYAYCPPLDVYGYGDSEEEAVKSFQTTIEEFFRYTLNKNTLIKELRRLGWKVHGRKPNRKLQAPNMTDIIPKRDYLQEIFDGQIPYQAKYENVAIPA